ncbi:helix-turn-helix domain-containing protein [Govanella unica]|uniref:Helix-turn-helix transcriptional regulator n=1 Tax=Govanella unica TaxID=2975056 RepID=A0A9X3Z5Y8_9PROT|nr:helix-turn-helix transcriptional regulator [Govania unica]MDA5192527.1 helix-turn-helix transcriptional regulator [Govania unica]
MTLPATSILAGQSVTSAPERENALEICHGILDCRNFTDLTQGILQRVTGFLDAETSVLFEFSYDGKGFRPTRQARHEVPEQALKSYDHYLHEDPVILKSFSPDGRYSIAPGKFDLVCLSELHDDRHLTNSSYYNEFLRPQHIHHVMALFFRPSVENASIFAFGFHRPRASRHFASSEMTRAMQVAPALFACVNGMTLTERLKQQEDLLSGLSRATAEMGVLMFDASRTLRYANPCAARLIGLDGPDSGLMPRPEAPIYAEILKLCARAKLTGGTVRERLGNDCTASAQMLEGDSQRILVTLSPSRLELSLETRTATLGMTRRENDIIRLVLAGQSNPQIADQLCLSTRTVENHLRSIFSKAAVHSRTQLVRLLLADD